MIFQNISSHQARMYQSSHKVACSGSTFRFLTEFSAKYATHLFFENVPVIFRVRIIHGKTKKSHFLSEQMLFEACFIF